MERILKLMMAFIIGRDISKIAITIIYICVMMFVVLFFATLCGVLSLIF